MVWFQRKHKRSTISPEKVSHQVLSIAGQMAVVKRTFSISRSRVLTQTINRVRVSAPEYVDYVLSWIEAQIDDPAIFPVNETEPFPTNFEQAYVRDIFKRMFRVFAIIYHRHFEKIQGLDAAAHLNTCFKHFIYFSIWYASL